LSLPPVTPCIYIYIYRERERERLSCKTLTTAPDSTGTLLSQNSPLDAITVRCSCYILSPVVVLTQNGQFLSCAILHSVIGIFRHSSSPTTFIFTRCCQSRLLTFHRRFLQHRKTLMLHTWSQNITAYAQGHYDIWGQYTIPQLAL
jgi:hypothetical protein